MDKDRFVVIMTFGIAMGIISFALWWNVSVWNECRESGSSFMYCWNMISRR